MSDSQQLHGLQPTGSPVHGIFQARVLESDAIAFSADGECSREIKRCLLLGKKAMINLDSILKSRDITLPTKVRLVKAMVFPIGVYGCESWKRKLSAEELMLLNCGVGEDS